MTFDTPSCKKDKMKKCLLYYIWVFLILPIDLCAQYYSMDLPPLRTFPPYQVDKERQTFVASWEALEHAVPHSITVYVGVERVAVYDGVQGVLETLIKGDSTLADGKNKWLGINSYVHDYMTAEGWYMRMGSVSKNGLVLISRASDPIEVAPLLQSPVFDASHDGGKFRIRFTASTPCVEREKKVILCIRHWADHRGTPMKEKTIELIADGQPHEYVVECVDGMDNECFNISPGVMGTIIELSGDIKVEQILKKGERIWRSLSFTQAYFADGVRHSKVNDLGIRVDTLEINTSDGAKSILDYEAHRAKGWRLFYTIFQMITAEDQMSVRASLYSKPVYFDEK